MAKKSTAAARLAVGILTLFLTAYGWLNLLQGGISIKGRNGRASYIDGDAALWFALGIFFFAALCGLVLAKSFSLDHRGSALLIMIIMLPPAVYVLWIR